jgi:elongation factor P
MMDMNDIRVGTLVKINGQPFICLWSDFNRTAQRKPVRRTKLRNLITGAILEQTFKHGDKIEEADVARSKASYLYTDEQGSHFMDNESYEQIALPKEMVAEQLKYMKDGLEYQLINFEGRPITVELPTKVDLKVTETSDVVRGDTTGNVLKEATLETGALVKVPSFIKQGEIIRINTDTGEYAARATE